MSDDGESGVSYEQLNAYVDGQLDRTEEGRLLEAIRREPALERRVSELRLTKDLVRHAYPRESASGTEGRSASARDGRWMAAAAAALALVAVGVGVGWTAHGWQQRGGDDFAWLARRAPLAQAAADSRVVLHVSSSAPERVTALLDDTEGMLVAARAAGRPVAIEILANNTGLDILRVDVPGPSARLASLRAENPNLTLVACRQTIERLRERGIAVQLLPDTAVATSALDEVVTRMHEGWTYIRL